MLFRKRPAAINKYIHSCCVAHLVHAVNLFFSSATRLLIVIGLYFIIESAIFAEMVIYLHILYKTELTKSNKDIIIFFFSFSICFVALFSNLSFTKITFFIHLLYHEQ